MKLVLISDTHNMHSQVAIPQGDLLLHAGDFTFLGKPSEIGNFGYWLDSLDMPSVVIPGNHELGMEKNWDYSVSLLQNHTVLNQSIVEIDGLTIYGEPRTPEFNNWAFNIPHNQMKEVWKKVPKNIDILLSHGPPAYCLDENQEGDNCGCVYLREWIEKNQPSLVVCGHIHEQGQQSEFIGKTQIVNASICTRNYKPTNKPMIVNL